MIVLVTGGSCFIGSNFVRHILGKYSDYFVINLDTLTYAGNPENLGDVDADTRYRFVHGDICDPKIVEPLMEEANALVHFAAESHVDRSLLGGAEFVRTNVYGTAVLLEAARRCRIERFVQISTDEVYGSLTEGAWTEDFPLEPRNPYSASKASAEILVRAYHLNHSLPVVITRASNNIGPCQYPEKRVPLYITNAIEDLSLPVYGNGLQVRDHLHVQDHCEAIDLVLHKGRIGESYNVGGENEANGIEVARAILEQLGKPQTLIEFVKDRSGHDQRYALDSSKIAGLGWKPRYEFASSLNATVKWYVENEVWWRRIKSGQDYKTYYETQYVKR